jgi:P27 family predicted phage terminase small subunit
MVSYPVLGCCRFNKMGRPRKTELQHWVGGTKSHATTIIMESSFAGGRPKPPQHLSGAARIEFKRVSKLLGARGTETPADASALALYAEVYSRWVDLKAALDGEYLVEVTVLDSNGKAHVSKRLNPLLKELNAVEGRLLGLVRELGITPRTREAVKPVAPDNPGKLYPVDSIGWLRQQEKINGPKKVLELAEVNPSDMAAGGDDDAITGGN